MGYHRDRDNQHEYAVQCVGTHHHHCRHVIHGISGKEEQRPPAANAGAPHEAITLAALQPDSSTEHHAGDGVDERYARHGAHRDQGHATKQREAQNQQHNA